MVNNNSSIINSPEPTHFESLYPDTTRFTEVEKILGFIKGGNSCQIISLPGVGRSNLLGLLAYNRNVRLKHLGENQKWFHFIHLNFSELRKKPVHDVSKLMFLALVTSLQERKMQEEYEYVNRAFKECLEMNDPLVLFEGLKRTVDMLAIQKELTLVFLFDRFEEYIPTLTQDLFTNLRLLRNRAKYRFSVIFSVQRPLEDIVEPSLFADFNEFLVGHLVFLSLYDKPGIDFRLTYVQKVTGKTLSPELITQLIKLTGGHGKLTRLSAEATLEQNLSIEQLTPALLSQKFIQAALQEIWLSLTPSEQQSILKKLPPPDSYLEQAGLLIQTTLTIPLLSEYISSLKQEEQTPAHITYDLDNNAILKAGVSITEKLTSAEFKLLMYLLQHAQRVIERDEVIQAVWSQQQSTTGVSEQALDQLIFRLRRKIEDDPNNPAHLITVKGRGIKFIP